MSATREVIAFAKSQGGIITSKEAIQLGMPSTTLSRRVSDGVFVRLGRGILALPGTSTRPDVMLRAAGRLMGAVISHESAARIHRMEPIPKSQPKVTVSHRSTYSFPGLVVHQSTDLLPEHVVELGGRRVTNPARTLLDLSSLLKRKRIERVVDNALASGIVDFEALVNLFLALTRRGKKGMHQMGEILRERARGSLVPATVLESKLFELLVHAELPMPQREFHAPWLEPIDGRVDFAYTACRIVVEADSRRWHGLFDAFENDRRRDIAAQLAGWIVLRITWKMITEDPTFVTDSVRSALVLRGAGT